ncbi:hypothetical protein pb186bvf_010934 [Paramecium bursaria]
MFQSFLCEKKDHKNNLIIAVCGNLCCLNNRLMCQQCINNQDHVKDLDYNQANIFTIETLQQRFDEFKIQHLEYIESQILCCLIESQNKMLVLQQLLNKELESYVIQLQTIKDLRELAANSSNLQFSDWFAKIHEQNSLNEYLLTIQEQVHQIYDKSYFLGDVLEEFQMSLNEFTKDIGEVVYQHIYQIEDEIKQNKIYKKLLNKDSTIRFEFLLNQVQVQIDKYHFLQNIEQTIQNLRIFNDADKNYLLAYCSYLQHDIKQANHHLKLITDYEKNYKKVYFIEGMIEMENNNLLQAKTNFEQSCDVLYPEFVITLIQQCQYKLSNKNIWNEELDKSKTKTMLILKGQYLLQHYQYTSCLEILNLAFLLYLDDFSCIKQICQAYFFFQEFHNALKILEIVQKLDRVDQYEILALEGNYNNLVQAKICKEMKIYTQVGQQILSAYNLGQPEESFNKISSNRNKNNLELQFGLDIAVIKKQIQKENPFFLD